MVSVITRQLVRLLVSCGLLVIAVESVSLLVSCGLCHHSRVGESCGLCHHSRVGESSGLLWSLSSQ